MNLFLMFTVFVVYLFVSRLLSAGVNRIGRKNSVNKYRVKYINKTLHILLALFFGATIIVVSGIGFAEVSLFLSSIFAILGVGLFAQWSILSNVTASLIIFFGFPYRVGDSIKIADKDDDISGIIDEITLFHVIIRKGDDLITYPNSMVLQKAVIKYGDAKPKTLINDDMPANDAENTMANNIAELDDDSVKAAKSQ